MAPAASRSDRYLGRVDSHLATFTTDKGRRLFLVAEIAKWQERYGNFAKSRPVYVAPGDAPPQAADFLLTIAGLNARLVRYSERVAA